MLLLLSVLCGISGFSCIILELNGIIKYQNIRLISAVGAMYGLVYGIVPSIIYLKQSNGITVSTLTVTDTYIINGYIVLLLSIIGYWMIKFGYYSRFRYMPIDRKMNRDDITSTEIVLQPDNGMLISITVMLIIGWISLYLWTRSYGSFANFMRNAARIRSGYGLENNMAFFKHFAKLLNFTTPLTVVMWIVNRKQHRKRGLWLSILTILSIIGSAIFLLCSDSRGNLGTILFVIILSLYEYNQVKKKKRIEKRIIRLFIWMMGLLVLISVSSTLMDRVRFGAGEKVISNIDVLRIISSEFSFTIKAQQASLNVINSNKYVWMLPSDLINSLFACLPNRLVPIKLPIRLWVYNTSLIKGANVGGTLPTDLLSASIHLFWVVGPLILPFLLGKITKLCESFFHKSDVSVYKLILKYLLMMKLMGLVSHYQLYSIIYENIYFFLALIIIFFVRNIKTDR